MHALLFFALWIAQGSPAPAQEPPAKDHEAIHREMEELIVQVEAHQRAIDRMLYQASTGRSAVGTVAGPSPGDLIQKALAQGKDDQRDIQRILDLAASHTHKGNGT
ncbi:MAG: hypothetical protein ABI054_13125 [Planctomycetota bacterium]